MNAFLQYKLFTNLEFVNSDNLGFAFRTLSHWRGMVDEGQRDQIHDDGRTDSG